MSYGLFLFVLVLYIGVIMFSYSPHDRWDGVLKVYRWSAFGSEVNYILSPEVSY